MNDVNDTLNRILELIDKDVTTIKTSAIGQLDSATAQSLCRYASTLAAIKDNKKKDSDKEMKDLNRLSTEELIALHHKISSGEIKKG